MKIKIFSDMNQYAIEIRHNNQRLIRYTKIPDNILGGELIILEESEKHFVYKLSPLYEKLETENGYILNYNIKLTNWLNYFIYKSVKSVISNTEMAIKREPADLSRILKESTLVKLI